MSLEHLGTGFYGKIPATGDFVGRGLPGDFVRSWDRWVASHLAPLQSFDLWADDVALRFLLGSRANGPMAGIVVPSSDRAGRRFPLTVAAPVSVALDSLAVSAVEWFDDVEAVADAARHGDVGPDAFAEELAGLPFPTSEAHGEAVLGMLFWTKTCVPMDVDPAEPRSALDRLLAANAETG
ncbi:type VI secretion system-associated protein TagF [Aminobacter aganoensis]|uniref:Type VI secretion system protein ImpM n=1 Tax=Aminobacter aganoensis TaxID=83264 RepID=A0A7X0F3J3_9HYPH|nr:type VI secretion system protein ImpM [Aminobacter aganoensis]